MLLVGGKYRWRLVTRTPFCQSPLGDGSYQNMFEKILLFDFTLLSAGSGLR